MSATTKVRKDQAHLELFIAAEEAGREAAFAKVPEPMVVVQRKNAFDDSSAIVKQYEPVLDGVCGFAWVNVNPGTSSFARWLKKEGHVRGRAYEGGVNIWIGHYRQSYERTMAHAVAMAKVLRENGIDAYASGRLD